MSSDESPYTRCYLGTVWFFDPEKWRQAMEDKCRRGHSTRDRWFSRFCVIDSNEFVRAFLTTETKALEIAREQAKRHPGTCFHVVEVRKTLTAEVEEIEVSEFGPYL